MTAGSIAVPTIIPLRLPVPGKLKHVIDIYTPIELKSETLGAEIFFTIDGSKPNPYAAVGADRSTIKYTKPFKLREGKKTVKAIAISRDGTRESHVVSKGFDVEFPDNYDEHEITRTITKKNDYEFIDEIEKERKKEIIRKRGILKKIVDTNNTNSFRSDGGSLSDGESSRYHKETRYLGHRYTPKSMAFAEFNQSLNRSSNHSAGQHNHHHNETTVSTKYVLPDSSVQTLRLQRETDFLKCIYCFATRPQDPQARYCNECGKNLPQIPQTKMIPPESGKLGTCFYCKSIVPFNTKICVICENPINPQLQPHATIKLQGKIICTNCTTANPANYATCVACDTKLVPGSGKINEVDLMATVPQHAVPEGKSATCGQCFRLNRADARFCDWCGAKPQKHVGPIACSKCGASNNPYSKFCVACSGLIQPPTNYNSSVSLATSTSNHGWLNQIDSKAMHILNKQYATMATQTYGLYYTSSKAIENKSEKALKLENASGEKKSLLTAISAGKGYWRQQMDHICAHLKAFAQNTPEFRSVVAEPRLGKINTAKVETDSTWCTVTATFPIRNNSNKDGFNSSATIDHALRQTSHLNQADYDMMAAAVAGRDSSLGEDSVSEADSDDSGKVRKHKKKLADKYEDKLSGEDRQLIKELSRNGRGRPREVEFCLREGANPNAVTKDGLSMLFNAIRNRHFEAIPVLLEANADIKAKTPKGDTVLHEAVKVGPEADVLLNMLLRHGANPDWKNKKNETAFDIAIKENNTAAVNVLGANVGENMIKTYLRSNSAGIRP